MVAIMSVRTTTRFMLRMRTALLFIVIFIVVILFIITHEISPLFPIIMEQEVIFHYGNYCQPFYNDGVNH
ncbi:hypothetical protein CON07_17755 [Bacillus sp. AFS094611]|uniref:Uncharacterized protein n=2 Tax=Bacillus cereus group TaxID=86661 RepID=A0A2A7DEK2_BACAN|nr:hypothetical protein BK707_13070 [Bacillus thuringiensis serovar coreanensis]OTX47892.1 hypothetical protein BK724_10240 [Bacillus thuringiensis serovar sooncheon]OTX54882.1 hypothetical protein BK725_11250 [Bacillus thuringiensis serovar guiyangiensis]OTX68937.1 hypothetical protein BK727_13535 [Bacillus thuringiensis serovar roskildiensis]PDZ18349.1 hypothetical protein CON16_03720 [Bacillus anthracis]PDZ50094.1 hypothetical protein CON07_17755 [Bacillus sp. AFS094611]